MKSLDRFELEQTDFNREDVEILLTPDNFAEGLPMFPQAIVRWPQAFNICASNSVVVVLPLVPVIAITGNRQERQPSSSSPMISIFRSEKLRASADAGIDSRTQHHEIVSRRIGLARRAGDNPDALVRQIIQGGFRAGPSRPRCRARSRRRLRFGATMSRQPCRSGRLENCDDFVGVTHFISASAWPIPGVRR